MQRESFHSKSFREIAECFSKRQSIGLDDYLITSDGIRITVSDFIALLTREMPDIAFNASQPGPPGPPGPPGGLSPEFLALVQQVNNQTIAVTNMTAYVEDLRDQSMIVANNVVYVVSQTAQYVELAFGLGVSFTEGVDARGIEFVELA